MNCLKSKYLGFSFILGLILSWGLIVFSDPPKLALKSQVFRLHLNTEPTSLKPWEQRNSAAGYLLSQISGTLLKYQNGVLSPSIAKKCQFKKKTLIDCEISSEAKFSDDSTITANAFKDSWLEFLNPKNKAFRADLLFAIKGAEAYFKGDSLASQVGLKTNKNHLLIELAKDDPDFLYNLISPLLAPQKTFNYPELGKSQAWISSGAFRIQSWELQKKITLQNIKNPALLVEFVFINEDSTALNLYEKGELSFLRRLPTLFISKYKNRSDFFQVAQNRLDYIGFGPKLQQDPLLREALTKSLDFDEITRLLASKGQFGCPGISHEVQDEASCQAINIKRAKEALALYRSSKKDFPSLIFAYSKQGGDDHKMVAEWLQSQWKKNLDLDVEIKSSENKVFLDELTKSPPSLFRKGVNPERPTCLSALEVFAEESPENYMKLGAKSFPDFFKNVDSLRPHDPPLSSQKKKQFCSQAIKSLNSNYLWIPTGPIHFSLLAKPEWTGWSLNELNQLDLSSLKLRQ